MLIHEKISCHYHYLHKFFPPCPVHTTEISGKTKSVSWANISTKKKVLKGAEENAPFYKV